MGKSISDPLHPSSPSKPHFHPCPTPPICHCPKCCMQQSQYLSGLVCSCSPALIGPYIAAPRASPYIYLQSSRSLSICCMQLDLPLSLPQCGSCYLPIWCVQHGLPLSLPQCCSSYLRNWCLQRSCHCC